jgi:hypothetical protein
MFARLFTHRYIINKRYEFYVDDWRADGYRWKQNGFSLIPNKEKVYKKIHFNINTGDGLSSSFQKFVFKKCDGDDNHVIVHYLGNDNIAVDFPHGMTCYLKHYSCAYFDLIIELFCNMCDLIINFILIICSSFPTR